MSVIDIINALRQSGVDIRVNGDHLELLHAKDKLSEELFSEIVAHKEALIQFIVQSTRHLSIEIMSADKGKPVYDLSFMQRNIWTDQQLHPDISFYNVGAAWTITGAIRTESLQEAIRRVTVDHEILRTVFRMIDWQPKQIVLPAISPEIILHDYSNDVDPVGKIGQFIDKVRDQVFDLSVAPLFRLLLLKEREHKYQLVFIIHHIIADGWSLRILFDQLVKHYQAVEKGQPHLPQLAALQYKDYAIWQHRQLERPQLAASRSYWQQQLGNGRSFCLTAYNLIHRQVSYTGATLEYAMPESFIKKMDDVCASLHVTRFVFMMAMINLVLYKYTGDTYPIVETGVVERIHSQVQEQIGPYLCIVPLCLHIDPQQSCSNYIQTVKAAIIAMYKHTGYPIHLIRKDRKLANEEDTPVTNVSFTFHNSGLLSEENIYIDDVSIEKAPYQPARVLKGISFHAYEYRHRMVLHINYGLELFDNVFVALLYQDLLHLTAAFYPANNCPLQEIVVPLESGYNLPLKFNFI